MSIASAAKRVARLLEEQNLKVVFAESCTGGLVSGALTAIPGISAYHCGGMVVYRNQTKRTFLDIPEKLLKNPGPVSREVTVQMAKAVLERTPEADLSVAVTGHLGPDAPADLDGVIHIVVIHFLTPDEPGVKERLAKIDSVQYHLAAGASRSIRQRIAVETVLRELARSLESRPET